MKLPTERTGPPPLIVQRDRTVLLDLHAPGAEECRTHLSRFAELVKRLDKKQGEPIGSPCFFRPRGESDKNDPIKEGSNELK